MPTLFFRKTTHLGEDFFNPLPTAKQLTTNKVYRFCRLQHFKTLSAQKKIEEVQQHGTKLPQQHAIKSATFVLYAYHGFFVELVIEGYTGKTRRINCFKNISSWNRTFRKLSAA